MALRLHAVTPVDANGHPSLHDGARTIVFRDLAAVVTERPKFALDDVEPTMINEHRAIVDALFKSREVLPTPPGVVFRTEHVLTRWMELHYVALTDALGFIGDRVAARVHVRRGGANDGNREAGSDLAEAAGGVFRELRRRAVASVPLTTEQVTGLVLSGAFLVERELWKDFERAYDDTRDANPTLQMQLTGPWAPYDFVRMQFGD
jgi:hypothetical protein